MAISAKGFIRTLPFAFAMATAACGSLFGPGDPERSIVGTYRGQWSFGVYDPDTIIPAENPPGGRSRGWIHCPADFQVTTQDGKDIRGTFGIRPQTRVSCDSAQAGFCSESLSAKFCRGVSGTFEGEAFSTGAREVVTILFKFRMKVGRSEGYGALGQFLGCTVTRGNDVFTGGVREDVEARAEAEVTVDCGGDAGLDRVDLAISLDAGRVSPER